MMNNEQLKIRPLLREELDMLLDWARLEGWNPGIYDAGAFWGADPEGFVIAEIEGEVIGGGSIVKYDDKTGFMGLFIVRPEHRGKGYGKELWHRRLKMLKGRLGSQGTIGLDGVENMQYFYNAGGFAFSHNITRHYARIKTVRIQSNNIVSLDTIAFEKVLAYDSRHFGASRPGFLKPWIHPEDGVAKALLDEEGEIRGIGVLRRCVQDGFKTGPLFAENTEAAEQIFLALTPYADGENIYLDAPEINKGALAITAKYNMKKDFTCGRMYNGQNPAQPWNNIFGVTSFELG